MWEKPNEHYGIMRCTNTKYAKKLVELGSIKFNTPQSWVEEEKRSGKGRGDILEGVFAACDFLDVISVLSYSQQYKDVYGDTINGLTYFRRKRTMNLPCYCFFLLKQGLFEIPRKTGIQKLSATIPGSYFKDFAEHLTEEEINNLEEDKRSAIVFISDPSKFVNLIVKKLMSLGVQESEIIYEIIEYENKKVPFYCTAESPMELKLKDEYFSYQAEGRIIVNTNNPQIIEYLKYNPIKIGDISDIAQWKKAYLYEGALIEMTADIYESL